MTSNLEIKERIKYVSTFLKENNKKINYLIGFLLVLVWGELAILGYSAETGKVLCAASIILTVSLIIRSIIKKNIVFILVSVYMFLYTYVTRYTFFYNIPISFHESFGQSNFIYKASLIHFLFLIIFCLVLKIPKKEDMKQINIQDNKYIFYLNFIIAFIAMILGRSGEMIFDSGGYGQGEVKQSTINEYFFIFFVVSFIFSGLKRRNTIFLISLAGIYCLKNLLFGGRIEVVMMGLCLFYLLFQYKMNLKQFALLLLVGISFFNLYGIVRGNPLILLEDNWYTALSEQNVDTNDFIMSQEGDVNQATSRIVGMADTNIIPFKERIGSFFYFIFSSVVPSSALPPIANLSAYNSNIYTVGGGGLISSYFYVFGSFPAVILIAMFLAYFFSQTGNNNKKLLMQLYIIFLVITLPRWFAYNPIAIIKLSVYGALITYFFYCVDFTMKKYSKKTIAQ